MYTQAHIHLPRDKCDNCKNAFISATLVAVVISVFLRDGQFPGCFGNKDFKIR